MKINSKILLDLEMQNENLAFFFNKSIEFPILAIDYGEKFSGLAYSPDGICCLALKTVAADDLLNSLDQEILLKNPKIIVLGLPLSQDQQENHICAKIRKFEKKLNKLYPKIKTVLTNERFSSQNVIKSRKLKHKNQRIDDLAASQILSFYLSEQK